MVLQAMVSIPRTSIIKIMTLPNLARKMKMLLKAFFYGFFPRLLGTLDAEESAPSEGKLIVLIFLNVPNN